MPPEMKTESKDHKQGTIHAVVQHLLDLKRKDDRAALAELRRSAALYPDVDERVYKHIGRFLGERPDRAWEDAVILVASLFGIYSTDSNRDINFGDTMRWIARERARRQKSEESTERRFLALLGADPKDLHVHLRNAITLAKASSAPIGWSQLLNDVTALLRNDEESGSRVVRRWARSYWGKRQEDETAETSETENT